MVHAPMKSRFCLCLLGLTNGQCMGLSVDGAGPIPHNDAGPPMLCRRQAMSKEIGGAWSICARHGIDALYVFRSRVAEAASAIKGGRSLTNSTGSVVERGVLPPRVAPLIHLRHLRRFG